VRFNSDTVFLFRTISGLLKKTQTNGRMSSFGGLFEIIYSITVITQRKIGFVYYGGTGVGGGSTGAAPYKLHRARWSGRNSGL
jgi:hypothetical protein